MDVEQEMRELVTSVNSNLDKSPLSGRRPPAPVPPVYASTSGGGSLKTTNQTQVVTLAQIEAGLIDNIHTIEAAYDRLRIVAKDIGGADLRGLPPVAKTIDIHSHTGRMTSLLNHVQELSKTLHDGLAQVETLIGGGR